MDGESNDVEGFRESSFLEASCSTSELVSYLKGTFRNSDYEKVAEILRVRKEESGKREASLKAELQRVAEETKAKDQRIALLEKRNEELVRQGKEREGELRSLLARNGELEDQCGRWEEECGVLRTEECKARMEIDMLTRKEQGEEIRYRNLERMFDELGCEKRGIEEEFEGWKNKYNKLQDDFRVAHGEAEQYQERNRMLLELLKKKEGEFSGRYTDMKFCEVESRKNMTEKELKDYKRRYTELEARTKKLEDDYHVIYDSGRKAREKLEGLRGILDGASHKMERKQEVDQQPSALNLVEEIENHSSRQPSAPDVAAKIDISSGRQLSAPNFVTKIAYPINQQPTAPDLVPKIEISREGQQIGKRQSVAPGGPPKFVIDISDSDEEIDSSPAPLLTNASRMRDFVIHASGSLVGSPPQGALTNLTGATPDPSLKVPMHEIRTVASDNNVRSSDERCILCPKRKLFSGVVMVGENDRDVGGLISCMANTTGLGDLLQNSQLASSHLAVGTSKMSSNERNHSLAAKENLNPIEEDRILSPKRRRLTRVVSDEDEDNHNSTQRTKKLLKDLLADNEQGKLNAESVSLDDSQRQVQTPRNKSSVHSSPVSMEADAVGYCEETCTFPRAPSNADPVLSNRTADAGKSVPPTRRRIHLLRECDEVGDSKGISSGQVNDKTLVPVDEDDAKDVKSTSSRIAGKFILENLHEDGNAIGSSDNESLGGFIVNGSDGSEAESSSSVSPTSELHDDSDSHDSLGCVLRRIQRKKGSEKWEFEADMLSSFQMDDQLCMKAVCALYRQQTSDEKTGKTSLYYNRRGFNKFDALRGSEVAEFLTGGDPYGPLKKSVKELERYNPVGVEYCRELAMRYSKQLFEIHKKQEDPFFLPSS